MSGQALTRVLLRIGFWIPLAVCTYLAFAPSPPEPVFRISDVVLHGFAFTYLTFALGLAHRLQRWWHTGMWMLAYGGLIELVQSFEPSRTAELKDFVVDGIGIAVGLSGLALFGGRVRALVLRVAESLVRA